MGPARILHLNMKARLRNLVTIPPYLGMPRSPWRSIQRRGMFLLRATGRRKFSAWNRVFLPFPARDGIIARRKLARRVCRRIDSRPRQAGTVCRAKTGRFAADDARIFVCTCRARRFRVLRRNAPRVVRLASPFIACSPDRNKLPSRD